MINMIFSKSGYVKFKDKKYFLGTDHSLYKRCKRLHDRDIDDKLVQNLFKDTILAIEKGDLKELR